MSPDTQALDGRRVALPAVVLFLVLALAETVAILTRTGGHLTYTLDDAYVHLALAESIAHGHYGLSPHEACAPASSVLWPVWLALFARWSVLEWVPLLTNLALGTASLVAVGHCAALALSGAPTRLARRAATGCTLLFVPAANLVGLTFTGMEHVLQVWLTVLAALGLWRCARTPVAPGWLVPALVAGPLVRFENLAVSVPALVFLWASGEGRRAWVGAGSLLAAVSAFALYLLSEGLSPMPSSLLVKSQWSSGELAGVLHELAASLNTSQGILLALFVCLMGWMLTDREVDGAHRGLAAVGAATAVLHLLAGRFGWYHRYEIYAWSFALLLTLGLFGAGLGRALVRRGLLAVGVPLALFVVLACKDYLLAIVTTPIAASNIHQQQAQMRRFATDYWRDAIAVNDVGYVAFRNDGYVLDLWGLASEEALRQRRTASNSFWMTELARRHDVRLAMLYEPWFPSRPTGWVALARLHLDGRRITPAHSEVTFYGLTADHAPACAALRDFAPSLPTGARLAFLQCNP